MNKSTLFASVLAVIVVVAIGAYVLKHPAPAAAPAAVELAFPELANATSSTEGNQQATVNTAPRTAPAGTKEYRNTQYSFSLFYPSDLTQTSYDEGGGASTIVFQNPSEALGFQIFIVPYTQSQISTARFKEDEPSGVRTNAAATSVAGVTAVSFNGSTPTLGDTYEVWFIRGGYLYEVTAPVSLASWLAPIIQSWQFI